MNANRTEAEFKGYDFFAALIRSHYSSTFLNQAISVFIEPFFFCYSSSALQSFDKKHHAVDIMIIMSACSFIIICE